MCSESELINFLQQTLNLQCPLQRRKKSEMNEMMKNALLFHMKNISSHEEAVAAQQFQRVFEPDGIFFTGTIAGDKKSGGKWVVMVGASWIFHRVGSFVAKDVNS